MGADLLPASSATTLWSAVLVYGLAAVVLGAHLVFALHRFLTHARAARKAAAGEDCPPPLAPGRAFLCGMVETDDDRPAVVLSIWQEGTEWARNRDEESFIKEDEIWVHRWKESSRHVEARPFTLRLPSGEAVRVLPDEHVSLMDTLRTRSFTGQERERVAEIVSGEHVCVEGVLLWNRQGQGENPYRSSRDIGAPTRFVLRRPRAEPLLIASGGLAQSHRRWATWYRNAAFALAALFAILHLPPGPSQNGALLAAAGVVAFWVLRRRVMLWYELRRVVDRGVGTMAQGILREEQETGTTVRRHVR